MTSVQEEQISTLGNVHEEGFALLRAGVVPFVASVHHTGTVFTLDFLQWHSQHNKRFEMAELTGQDVAQIPADVIAHFHINGSRADSRGFLEVRWPQIRSAINAGRCVIPLRDPLLALIAREKRLPGADHRFIVDGFTMLPGLTPKAWLRVDNNEGVERRRDMLAAVLMKLGMSVEPYISRYALEWAPKNAWGDGQKMARAYVIRDRKSLYAAFPMCFDYLVDKRDLIKPFLEDHGYKDLLWW